MKSKYELPVFFGTFVLVCSLGIGGAVYFSNKYYSEEQQRIKSHCEKILQTSAIIEGDFCNQECRRGSLVELVDKYQLEDVALAYRLATNKCRE